MFDDPPIVYILEHVACDLLLMTAATAIWIFYRVHMRVRVQPARLAGGRVKRVAQSDLGAKGHVQRLALG